MIASSNHIKIKQLSKVIQKELARLFLTEAPRLFNDALVSVTMVDLSSDLHLAKIYLSISLNENKPTLLNRINNNTNNIRKLLAKRIAGKISKVPHLKFILDNSVIQGARVTALIDELDLSIQNGGKAIQKQQTTPCKKFWSEGNS